MSQYDWPLNENAFTCWERLRLAAFVLNPRNRWTQGEQVAAFEREMAEFVGCRHAVFVSSGSTANTLLAMYLSDRPLNPMRDEVVFPSTTWTTSVSPFLREGFSPCFIDVQLSDLSMNLDLLEEHLARCSYKTAAVFVTSLLGICPDIPRLLKLKEQYPDIRFWMDNCENTFGTSFGFNISSCFTSTTSTYFGHQLQSVEGGFVFTNSDEERDYFLMARNHGMTRGVADPRAYQNSDVDPRFDFYLLGNNFRNSDIHAFIGRMDLRKADSHIKRRRALYQRFAETVGDEFVTFGDRGGGRNVLFSIPLIPAPVLNEGERRLYRADALTYCTLYGIETRPIISGSLLRQRAYRQYGEPEDFPISEYLHRYGFYVGLYPGLSEDRVDDLTDHLREPTSRSQ